MFFINLYRSSCVLHCLLQHNSFNPVLLIFGTGGRYFADRKFICLLHPVGILIVCLCIVLSEPLSAHRDITVASEEPEINKEILLARGNSDVMIPLKVEIIGRFKSVLCTIYRQYTTIYHYSDKIYTIRSHYGYMFRPKRSSSGQ